jgi:hypothetical protein
MRRKIKAGIASFVNDRFIACACLCLKAAALNLCHLLQFPCHQVQDNTTTPSVVTPTTTICY